MSRGGGSRVRDGVPKLMIFVEVGVCKTSRSANAIGSLFDRLSDWHKVVAARKLEIAYFKSMRVYEKVSRSEVRAQGGKVITTRWIDTNKGDALNPDHRSRLVGREIKTDNRLDMFSATPPLETLKMLISMCARGQSRPGKDPLKLATIDIKRALLQSEGIYISKFQKKTGSQVMK